MIQQKLVYNSRPKCERCGWVCDWTTSSLAQSAVDAKAMYQFNEHTDFWHV